MKRLVAALAVFLVLLAPAYAIDVKNAAGTTVEIKSTGDGSGGDPYIPEHLETNSADIKTAVEAIQAAAEILDNAISGNEAQVDVLTLPALPAGTNGIGKLTSNSGVDIGDVTINNANGANAVHIQDGGNIITVDGTVTITFPTAASVYRNTSFTEASVKASAGTLYGISIVNTNASVRYLQIYNTAGTPVNGTTTVIETYPLAGFDNQVFNFGDLGTAYDTGIGIGCTTDLAGTTDASAGDCGVGAVRYK